MKDTWTLQAEQLREWKKLILAGAEKDVIEQINDILYQLGDSTSECGGKI